MDRYYYLASELPFLVFAKEPPISSNYFLEEAKKWLTYQDFSLLSKVNINDFSKDAKDLSVLREYKAFEERLCCDLALWRKSKKEGSEYKPPAPLASLVKEGNPLEIEKKLLQLRFKFIEDKEKEHYFDLEFLILYFLKLQILERLFTFNKEKGIDLFQKVCAVNL